MNEKPEAKQAEARARQILEAFPYLRSGELTTDIKDAGHTKGTVPSK